MLKSAIAVVTSGIFSSSTVGPAAINFRVAGSVTFDKHFSTREWTDLWSLVIENNILGSSLIMKSFGSMIEQCDCNQVIVSLSSSCWSLLRIKCSVWFSAHSVDWFDSRAWQIVRWIRWPSMKINFIEPEQNNRSLRSRWFQSHTDLSRWATGCPHDRDLHAKWSDPLPK